MTAASEYRVLARKYRPQGFGQLIGQEAMVRTLKNAMAAGRLAHAFILTGVRGVGKTTTARIIARALNCVGADGAGGPTVEPCGTCAFCTAIAASRHPDVIEMDAASHTGVDDVRAIIDNVPYAATSARYKVYIIDEVHMLSKSAFNALLKTLEEPPAHVKFIFATTEIRKVPVTVLSRCQRFDLKRVEAAALKAHFAAVLKEEGCAAEDEALSLIARAAEGSVRDGLSLLDQAIAHGGGAVRADEVRAMIGLADRAAVIDLYQAVMQGDASAALAALRQQYDAGADPLVVLEDMAVFTHWLTRLKVAPTAAEDSLASEAERRRGEDMAAKLSLAVLSRTWQLLLKGLEEVRRAAGGLMAAEMVLIRLCHASSLPPPGALVRQLINEKAVEPASMPAPSAPPAKAPGAVLAMPRRAAPVPAANPTTFEELTALFEARKEGLIALALRDHVHLVSFAPGRVEIRPTKDAPRDLASRMMACLAEWTGNRWLVALSGEKGAATLHEQEKAADDAARAEALSHPMVQKVMAAFPGARLVAVRPCAQDEAPGAPENGAASATEEAFFERGEEAG
ncbi:MAG: DNA polymerase III subunit gamma/tau [Pseudomonadota bacterium]